MFDEHRFNALLQTHTFGRHTVYFDIIDSTNTWLKQHGESLAHGTICIADGQSKGRGQYQRKWLASKGENLTWSILLRPATTESLYLLTLAFMASLCPVLESYINEKVTLKWPNDLMVQQRKIAGVLAEGVFNGRRMDRLIIGIGLNVNQTTFDGLPHAGSLKGIGGFELDRVALLSVITLHMEQAYEQWLDRNPALIRGINERLRGYGEWVEIEVDGQPMSEAYLFLGINQQGHLHMLDKEYTIHTYTYEQVRIFTS